MGSGWIVVGILISLFGNLSWAESHPGIRGSRPSTGADLKAEESLASPWWCGRRGEVENALAYQKPADLSEPASPRSTSSEALQTYLLRHKGTKAAERALRVLVYQLYDRSEFSAVGMYLTAWADSAKGSLCESADANFAFFAAHALYAAGEAEKGHEVFARISGCGLAFQIAGKAVTLAALEKQLRQREPGEDPTLRNWAAGDRYQASRESHLRFAVTYTNQPAVFVEQLVQAKGPSAAGLNFCELYDPEDAARELAKTGMQDWPILERLTEVFPGRPSEIAFEALQRRAVENNPPNQIAAVQLLSKIRLLPEKTVPLFHCLLEKESLEVQMEILRWLPRFGESAEQALSGILDRMREGNSSVSATSIEALFALGLKPNEVVPEILNHLLERHMTGDPRVLSKLNRFGPEVMPALEQFAQSVAKLDSHSRGVAAVEMGRWGAGKDIALSTIRTLLKDPDDFVREHALVGLMFLGRTAGPATSEIVEAFSDESHQVRLQAVRTLARVTSEPEVALPALVKQMKTKAYDIRSAAAFALRSYGSLAQPYYRDLVSAVDGPDARTAGEALITLSALGMPNEVLPVFQELLKNSPMLRTVALKNIGRLGWAARDAGPDIAALVNIIPTSSLDDMVQALIDIRAEADVAIPVFATALREGSYRAGEIALEGLSRFAHENERARSAIFEAVGHKTLMVKFAATEWIGRLRLDPETAIPLLVDRLKDKFESPDVAFEAALSLGEFESEADGAVDALITQLKEGNARLRVAIIKALGKIGSQSERVIPELVKILADADSDSQIVAMESLLNYGVVANQATPALQVLVNDANASVRWKAMQTMVALNWKSLSPGLENLVPKFGVKNQYHERQ